MSHLARKGFTLVILGPLVFMWPDIEPELSALLIGTNYGNQAELNVRSMQGFEEGFFFLWNNCG